MSGRRTSRGQAASGCRRRSIDAVLAGRDPKLTDPHERAVHRFAARAGSPAQAVGRRIRRDREGIGRDGVAEVLVLLGYYTSVALGMKVHEVPIPAQAPA